MGKKAKESIGAQLVNLRWKNASAADKSEAARNRAQGKWARWRASNGKPPKPGDEKFVDLSQTAAAAAKRKGKS
jgi:hypothetical protein